MVTTLDLQRRGLRYAVSVTAVETAANLAELDRRGLPYAVEVADGATMASRAALEARGLAYFVPVLVDATPASKASLAAQGLRYAVKVDADILPADRLVLERQGLRYFVAVDSSGNSVAAGAVGGAALLVDETDGFATDFTHAADVERVAVKVSNAVTSYGLNSFYQNGGTSPKTVWDAAGNLVWSPHNLALQSSDFSQTTPWNLLSNLTVTTNAVAAPDGTLTADRLVETATTANHSMLHANIAAVSGETYTYSVYAKAGERTWLAIAPANQAPTDWFNLGTGALGTTAKAGAISDAGNGWYRCSITEVAATTTRTIYIWLRTADGQTGTYAGSTSNGLYLWGAQVNRGATPATYIATTTAIRNGLAVDYDQTTHVAKGLLVEPAATNSLLNSATLSTQSVSSTAAASTLSFWGTGTVTLSGTSTAGPLVGTGANNRVSLTFTPTAGTLTLTVTGTVTRAQFEANPSATSYIPTFGAGITRAADNYTFLLSTIPALGSEYSIYERFSTPVITNARYAVALTEGVGNELAGFVANTTARLSLVDGGSAVGAIVGPTLVANTAASAAARIKLNDLAMSVAGGAAAFDTTATLPTPTEVRFGNIGSNAVATASFYVEKLAIVPRGWSNAELATKSAT